MSHVAVLTVYIHVRMLSILNLRILRITPRLSQVWKEILTQIGIHADYIYPSHTTCWYLAPTMFVQTPSNLPRQRHQSRLCRLREDCQQAIQKSCSYYISPHLRRAASAYLANSVLSLDILPNIYTSNIVVESCCSETGGSSQLTAKAVSIVLDDPVQDAANLAQE